MMMDFKFVDLVDVAALRRLLSSFYEATGIPHGLVDEQNRTLSAIGWQEACTNFHRAHPLSLQRCIESNHALNDQARSCPYAACRCRNGLMDYATAIVVEGRLLATLYFGQILHEPPDMEYFRRQAHECGFDEEPYLAAIARLPVLPLARVQSIMTFYGQLAQMLARSGLEKLRQRQLTVKLRELAAYRESIGDEERKRIGRELHEELAQYLSALKLQMSALKMDLVAENSTCSARADGLMTLLDRTLLIARGVAVAVRPPVLDMGIGPAVEWLAAEYWRTTGIPCLVEVPASMAAMAEPLLPVAFRIIQEALETVKKQRSLAVTIRFVDDREHWQIDLVAEGGVYGLSRGSESSLGVVAMHEWALAMGGAVDIDDSIESRRHVAVRLSKCARSVV